MRRVLGLVGLALVTAFGSAGEGVAAEGRVTFNAKRLSLGRLATTLGKVARLTIVIDPQLSEVPVTVMFQDATPDSAVRTVFENLRLDVPDAELDWKDNVYRITLKPGGKVPKLSRPVNDEPARKFTLALGNVPLREALALAYRLPGPEMKDAKLPVEVEAGVPDPSVNLTFSHDNERVAVRLMVRQAATVVRGLGYTNRDGKTVVGIFPGVSAGSQEEFKELHAPPLENPERRLVMSFRNTPLKQVLSMVFDGTLPRFGKKFDIEVGETVPNSLINFSLVTGNVDQAVDALLVDLKKQLPDVEIKRVGQRLMVTAKNL